MSVKVMLTYHCDKLTFDLRRNYVKEDNSTLALTPKMRRCAERITSPDFDGNISKLCDELKIARSTFYRWYDKNDFKQYINNLIEKYTESELASIWKTIVESAKKGNLQALKLFFDLKNSQNKNNTQSAVVFISGEDKVED